VFDNLTRGNVDGFVVGEIGAPKGGDARVKVVEVDGRRVILKDMHDRSLLSRLIGRRLLAREFRTYRRLQGVDGVPCAYRMLDRDALLIEHVDGVPLSQRYVRRGLRVTDAFYRSCFELLDRVHARGVVHLDLRNKKNFLVGAGEQPYVVDFATAVYLPGWLPFRGRVLRWLGAFDRAGVLKMKRRMSPGLFDSEDRRWLDGFERTRALVFPHTVIVRAVRRFFRRRKKAKAGRRPSC